MPGTIRQQVEKLQRDLLDNEAQRIVIKARIKAVQLVCTHPLTQTKQIPNLDGGTRSHWQCQLCYQEKIAGVLVE